MFLILMHIYSCGRVKPFLTDITYVWATRPTWRACRFLLYDLNCRSFLVSGAWRGAGCRSGVQGDIGVGCSDVWPRELALLVVCLQKFMIGKTLVQAEQTAWDTATCWSIVKANLIFLQNLQQTTKSLW